MEKFVFKESKDKKVLAFISAATVILLVFTFIIAFLGVNKYLSGASLFLTIIIMVIVFTIILIWYLKKKIIIPYEYSFTEDGIYRKELNTNTEKFYHFSDISAIDNDSFYYKGDKREYLRIRFRSYDDYFTVQSEPFKDSPDDNFIRFKSLFYQHIDMHKLEIPAGVLMPKRTYSNLMFYIAVVCLIVLIAFPILLVLTGKTHKYMGLIPLYIAFAPIIYIGFSSKRRKNNGNRT
jgi:hypothetical protein